MRTKFSGFLTLIMAFMVQIGFAQQQTITGTVTDSDNGMPLAGVNIVIEGTSTGTQSDFDGNYSISADQGQTLVFSYIGYGETKVTVGTSSVINVDMATSTAELTEVVVVAYGEQEREEITSAISTVNAEEIEQIPIASVDQLLQGRVAGLNATAASGQPGQSGSVVIRGVGTFGSTDPLYVVDGIVVDPDTFRSMSQNDIASMSVLKDASASALYGNRAANGVILITTKRGQFDSPLQVNYRSMFGVSLNTKPGFDVMNAQQYLTFSRDYMPQYDPAWSGYGVGMTDTEIAAIAAQTNTNWADIMFRKGMTMSHQVTLSQGTEKSRSYTSMEYYEQEGLTQRSDLQRFSFRSNIDVKASEKFDYSTSLTLNYSKNNFVVDPNRNSLIFAANTGGELDNPFIVPYLGLPYLNAYNPDGSLNYVGTVLSGAIDPNTGEVLPNASSFLNTPFLALNTAKFNTDKENELVGIGSIRANYHFNDNFTLGAQLGAEYNNIEALFISSPLSIRGMSRPNINSEFKGEQLEAFYRDFRTNFNPYLKYEDTFNEKHHISAGVFMEYLYRNIQTNGSQVFGLDPKLPESGVGFVDGTVTEGPDNDVYYYIPNVYAAAESETTLFSYFGTLDYGYDDRYGISLSLRRDATSRLSKENRWGTFFAAGARWNITEEDFLKDSETFDLLKLRIAYGEVGRQPPGFYDGLRRISSITGYRGAPGYVPTELTDPDLVWETTLSTNIGIDFGLFDRALSGSIDLYDKNTEDLYYNTPVSLSSGFSTILSNVAEINNRGAEVELKYNIINKEDWFLSVFANAAYNKNEVKALAPGTEFQRVGSVAREIGKPLGSYYVTRYAGVNPANGQPLYYDKDGNLTEQFTEDDAVFLDKSMFPTYTGGFGLDVEYKGFSLNTLFSFAADQYRINGSLATLEDVAVAATSNQSVTMLDAWQQPGDITSVPALSAGSLRLNRTDRYLEDTSFLRLRNVTLAYTFDEDVLAKSNVFTSIRIYVQGTNLITWSKWRGFDPETVTDSSSFFEYPTPRQFTTGVDLSF